MVEGGESMEVRGDRNGGGEGEKMQWEKVGRHGYSSRNLFENGERESSNGSMKGSTFTPKGVLNPNLSPHLLVARETLDEFDHNINHGTLYSRLQKDIYIV